MVVMVAAAARVNGHTERRCLQEHKAMRVVVDGEQVVASVEDDVEGVWPDAVAAAESG